MPNAVYCIGLTENLKQKTPIWKIIRFPKEAYDKKIK